MSHGAEKKQNGKAAGRKVRAAQLSLKRGRTISRMARVKIKREDRRKLNVARNNDADQGK